MAVMITLTASDGTEFAAWRAEPEGSPRGGLVILQEIFGLNQHIREVTEKFAAAGWLAVAPALFDRAEKGVELAYDGDGVAKGRELKTATDEKALLDVSAALDSLAGSGRLGVVGYCWGGSLAWRAAAEIKGLAACVAYYGGDLPGLKALQPHCPVMAHFGAEDSAIPLDGVEAFKAAQPDLPVHIWPAGHGFNCDHRASFHAQSAAEAGQLTEAFLSQHMAD